MRATVGNKKFDSLHWGEGQPLDDSHRFFIDSCLALFSFKEKPRFSCCYL